MNFDYRLLVKYLIEELTSEEFDSLMAWRKESLEHEGIFGELILLKISKQFEYYNTSEKTEKALAIFNKRINKQSRKLFIRTFLKYAAIILLIISVALFSNIYIKKNSYIVYKTKAGEEIRKVYLEDGSVVWLNRFSTLKIPISFSSKKRNIILDGEAYFDIYKNSSAPFFVYANQLSIKVLGTSFNVKTNDKRQEVETILTSGRVILFDKNNKAVYQMSPGEKVTYNTENKEYTIENIDVNVSTAWYLEQLTFEDATLREIVNKLAIKFDVNINLESKKLAERRFRFVINKEEPLEDVLNILKYFAPIQYRIEGNEVFIYE